MKKFERVNKTKIPDKVLNEFTVSGLFWYYKLLAAFPYGQGVEKIVQF